MLTPQDVLDYIKNSLATDISGIEFDDKKILEIVRTTALPQFSQFVPDFNEITIDPEDARFQEPTPGIYRIVDPDNRRIIAIEKVIPSQATYAITGHPIIGVTSFDQLPQFTLDTELANTTRIYSPFHITFDFIPPNKIRILPLYAPGPFTVIYSREHAPDFSTIPLMYSPQFLKMALGSVMVAMGRARTRFGSVSTPFGEITLAGDTLVSDGRELINEAKEELQTSTIPFIEIDIG